MEYTKIKFNIVLSKFKDNIDIKNLKLTIKNTFDKRESLDYLKDYEQILDGISSYDRIVNYCNRPFKNTDEMNKYIIRKWN